VKSTVAIVVLHGLNLSDWRLWGPLESIRCVDVRISVSVLFALVTRLLDRDAQSAWGKGSDGHFVARLHWSIDEF